MFGEAFAQAGPFLLPHAPGEIRSTGRRFQPLEPVGHATARRWLVVHPSHAHPRPSSVSFPGGWQTRARPEGGGGWPESIKRGSFDNRRRMKREEAVARGVPKGSFAAEAT